MNFSCRDISIGFDLRLNAGGLAHSQDLEPFSEPKLPQTYLKLKTLPTLDHYLYNLILAVDFPVQPSNPTKLGFLASSGNNGIEFKALPQFRSLLKSVFGGPYNILLTDIVGWLLPYLVPVLQLQQLCHLRLVAFGPLLDHPWWYFKIFSFAFWGTHPHEAGFGCTKKLLLLLVSGLHAVAS